MLALSASTEMEGKGDNVKKVKKWWNESLLINNPLMRGFGLVAGFLTHINMYTHTDTHHTQTQPQIFLKKYIFICPSSSLCARLSFSPSLSLNQKKRHCLSLPLVFCVHARIHIHRHTSTVRAQIRNHLHPQRLKHTHTYTITHTHRLPSAAVMAPSCQNTLAFSPSLTKAAWLSLSMQVHRDCCLSTLILSFLTFSSAVCILILLSRAFQPLPTYILNNALLYVPVYCIRLSFKCLSGTLSVHKGLYWLVKVFAQNTFPHYAKQSQNWIHCFVFLSPPFLAYMATNFYPPVCIHACEDFHTLLLTIQFETQWVLDFIWKLCFYFLFG